MILLVRIVSYFLWTEEYALDDTERLFRRGLGYVKAWQGAFTTKRKIELYERR